MAALGLCSGQVAVMGWSPAGDEGNGGQGMDSLAARAAARGL